MADWLDLRDFADRRLRHREDLIADARDHRGGDRQRQRQLDDEAGALAGFGLDPNGPAQLLQRFADDVHAEAAAADPVGLVARREARRADQLEQRRVVERAGGHGQPGFARARGHALGVDAAAIVGNLDRHGFAGRERAQAQAWPRAACRRPRAPPGSRCRG